MEGFFSLQGVFGVADFYNVQASFSQKFHRGQEILQRHTWKLLKCFIKERFYWDGHKGNVTLSQKDLCTNLSEQLFELMGMALWREYLFNQDSVVSWFLHLFKERPEA